MQWKVAVVLTMVGLSPLSAQRPDRHRPIRIDIPPINVNVPEMRIAVPAMNFEIPAINIDLSGLGAQIEAAVNEAMRSIEDWDYDLRDPDYIDASRVQRLRRQWRDAVRQAETTNDWDQADALARQLTRAADRLKRLQPQ